MITTLKCWPTDKELGETLLVRLANYGIFLVPEGEVGCWLTFLNVSGHGSDWLVTIFSKIGQNEDDSDYIKPISDNVWKFLETISEWIQDANRLGT